MHVCMLPAAHAVKPGNVATESGLMLLPTAYKGFQCHVTLLATIWQQRLSGSIFNIRAGYKPGRFDTVQVPGPNPLQIFFAHVLTLYITASYFSMTTR